jgi:hypothetical protein
VPGSSVSTVSDYGLDGRGSIPDRGRGSFPLPSASRPALGPTQPPIQWVPGALSPGVKRGRGVMLTTHPLIVPWLRKSRSYISSHPNAPLWSVTGPLYLYLYYFLIARRVVSTILRYKGTSHNGRLNNTSVMQI